ncbi:extracellular solute-binding protein [Pseudactinotalea terrae]|uniref:extracellular solute-binding protein n=1 Tax=Pseudactinotalea terrae TaxID=1743262 RepID=UPI0012E0D3F0|nr:extracellular solute-binding protein [Pseudactinotalea terrae]
MSVQPSRSERPGGRRLSATLSRRTLLTVGVGVVSAGALAACRSATPGDAGGGGGGGEPPATLTLPTFVAPPEVEGATVSSVEGVPVAYSTFGSPYRSVTEPPGSGGEVTTFQPLFRPPPPPLDENPWWQQLNERLGVTINALLAPSDSYADKLSTTIAGGDIPDLTVVSENMAPGAIKLVKQGAFLDLTDVIGGDAIKEYPNLAAIPTRAWKDAAVENRIYGVPMPIADGVTMYRQDWAEAIGFPDPPTDADEVKELLVAFSENSPPGQDGVKGYGFSSFDQGVDYCQQLFHVPNNWAVSDDGQFTHKVETEEYEQALVYGRELWEAGVWHPDAPTHTGEEYEDIWLGGRGGCFTLNVANIYNLFYVEGTKPFDPVAFDGGDPTIWQAPSIFAFTAISSQVTDEERLKELLGVLNWWAAPFGSEEYLHIAYGLEGRQFNFEDGEPIAIDDPDAQTERNLYWMVQQFEQALYVPGHPDRAAEAQKQLEHKYTYAVTDPSRGLYSDEKVSKAASLAQLIDDYQVGIITGRRDISELDDLRSRWATGGGDTIKTELGESYAVANS